MSTFGLQNLTFGVVAASFDASQVTLALVAGQGNRFDAASLPERAVLWNVTDHNNPAEAFWAGDAEIIEISSKATDTLTIIRAQEGTTGIASTLGKEYQVAVVATQAALFDLFSPTLVVSSAAAADASVIFREGGTDRWQVGYDASETGLIIGRISFANPVVKLYDTSGRIDVTQATDNACLVLTKTGTGAGQLLYLTNQGTGVGFTIDQQGAANAAQIVGGAATVVVLNQANNFDCIAINKTGTGAGIPFNLLNAGTGIGAFLNQDGNAVALGIDSEATSNPLIDLAPIDGNSRGDISANGTARATDPSSPSNGDIWYNGGENRWKARLSGRTVTFANKLGPAFGAEVIATISGGVANPDSSDAGVLVLAAESGTADDLDTLTVTGSGEILPGDTLILRADTGDTITVKHNTGNIHLDGSADKALVNGNQFMVIWNGTDFEQLTPMMVLP